MPDLPSYAHCGMDIEVRERDVALSPPPHLETPREPEKGGYLEQSLSDNQWIFVHGSYRVFRHSTIPSLVGLLHLLPRETPALSAGCLVNCSPKMPRLGRVGNQCRDRVFQGFFSTAERRADIASLDYRGSFGDSLVSMPQPDSISSRVESVLVGPSTLLMLALAQHLSVLFYRTAVSGHTPSRW